MFSIRRPVLALVARRAYSTKVDFAGVSALIQSKKNYTLIDVREKNELLQGHIPTARNVPLSQFAQAFVAEDDDFEQAFGFPKPDHDSTVVVYCQAGIRSAKAAAFLDQLGYHDVQNYQGSWADYSDKTAGGKKA